MVASEAFKGLFHAGVQEMHAAVVQGHRHPPARAAWTTPSDLVKDALAVVNPSMANAIPDAGARPCAVGISQSRWAELFMRGADLAGWLIVPSALGRRGLLHRGGPPRRATGGGRSRSSARASSPSASCIFAVLGALLNVVADVGQDPRQRTALRAVFWSTMHVLNVTGKVSSSSAR